MTTTLKTAGLGLGIALFAATSLLGAGGLALAEDKPVPSATSAKEFKDERALKLLRSMSDTLAGAKALSFRIRGIVPVASPTGQYVSMFASTSVVMQRPAKLFVQARGDLFPSDLYFDGKTLTSIDLGGKFFAQRDAVGGAIEALLKDPHPGSEIMAPFLELLVPDPYAVLTKDFSSAFWVGQSTIGSVKTDHLAFTAKGLDWEIWIGTADKLPRLMVVSYRTGERQPTFTVEFSDWKLNAPVPAQTFTPKIPKGAVRIEFKPFAPAPTK